MGRDLPAQVKLPGALVSSFVQYLLEVYGYHNVAMLARCERCISPFLDGNKVNRSGGSGESMMERTVTCWRCISDSVLRDRNGYFQGYSGDFLRGEPITEMETVPLSTWVLERLFGLHGTV